MDMNEHILRGPVARRLLSMGLVVEATHQHWGPTEPHTFIGGVDPIDGVWHTPDLEVAALVQLSFHEGLGDRGSLHRPDQYHHALSHRKARVPGGSTRGSPFKFHEHQGPISLYSTSRRPDVNP